MTKSASKGRMLLRAALVAGGVLLLSGLSGCVISGGYGYGCGPVVFRFGWHGGCP